MRRSLSTQAQSTSSHCRLTSPTGEWLFVDAQCLLWLAAKLHQGHAKDSRGWILIGQAPEILGIILLFLNIQKPEYWEAKLTGILVARIIFISMYVVVVRSVLCPGKFFLIAEVWCQFQTSWCGMPGGQIGTETILFSNYSVRSSQCYLIIISPFLHTDIQPSVTSTVWPSAIDNVVK
jgi:hypothetical protein